MVVVNTDARVELLEGAGGGIQAKLELKYKDGFVPYKTFVQKTYRDKAKEEDDERERRFQEEDQAPAKKVLRKALLKRILKTRLTKRLAEIKAEKASAPVAETRVQKAKKFFEAEIEKLKALPPEPKKKPVEPKKPKVVMLGQKMKVKKAVKKAVDKSDE